MAKIIVTFEDVEEGVSVKIESDPPFPGPDASQEEQDSLTDAQDMGLRMTQLLTEEIQSLHNHDCLDKLCPHDHGD